MLKKHAILLSIASICAIVAGQSSNASATSDISSFADLKTCITDSTQSSCEISSDIIFNDIVAIDHDVTIVGNDHTLTRQDSYTGGLFDIANGAKLSVEDLTIDGSASTWKIDFSPENLDYYFNACASSDCRVYGGYVFQYGEGDTTANIPLFANNGELSLESVTVQNTVNSGAGGVITNSGKLAITNSSFQHNSSLRGGVIYSNNDDSDITISDSEFSGNNAGYTGNFNSRAGGAIYVATGKISISDSEFSENSSENDGGALYIANAEAAISNNVFRNNKSANDGSAIRMGLNPKNGIVPQTATFSNNVFDGNISLGFYWEDGTPKPGTDTPARSNSEGTISYYGSGYDNISFNSDTFKNAAASWGGALSMYYCTDDEIAAYGSVVCGGPNITLDNVTISNNRKSNAASLRTNHDIIIRNSIIENNTRAINATSKNLTISDTIIRDNGSEGSYNTAYFFAETGTVDNLTYTGNAGRPTFAIDDAEIKNSSFSENNGTGLYVYCNSAHPVANYTIADSSFQNNRHTGIAGGIRIAAEYECETNVHITGNTIITGNQLAGNESDGANFGRGSGIGVSSLENSKASLTVDESVVLKNNHAEYSGDELALIVEAGSRGLTANLPNRFVVDSEGDRASESSDPIVFPITIDSETVLSAAYDPSIAEEEEEEPSEPTPEDKPGNDAEEETEEAAENPDTFDGFAAIIASTAASLPLTFFALAKFGNRH